jgi:methylated-DNA-protein-cysteine methyltransferase-like protein
MLPVSRASFCCTWLAAKPLLFFQPQGTKHAGGLFVDAVAQSAVGFSSMPLQIGSEVVNKMSWDIVYRVVKQIPRGRVLSYGALAKALRLPGGARSAGRAMAATPSGKGIPWHRVVGERGKILIREPYASLQKKLLESEGVKVVESRVDLKSHLWNPPRKTMVKTHPTKVKGRRRPTHK